MLQLPDARNPSGLALILCPDQNLSLDFTRLASGVEPTHAHHHRDSSMTPDDSGATVLDFSEACGLWAQSNFNTPTIFTAISVEFDQQSQSISFRSTASREPQRRSQTQPRAPPHLV
ncbi:MAG: hypothetical protein ACI915_002053 [Gammaproteobacteria bacterium]|jgi:hypothetical protein